MDSSRKKNSIKNATFNIGGLLLTSILAFVNRTFFVHVLGNELLGVSSVFVSLISMLNMAELGIGSAVSFSMFKPVAEGDHKKICALMNFYKTCYFFIGMIIAVIGVILLPFLNSIIDVHVPTFYLYGTYSLYLIETVLSYWLFAYKSQFLFVLQKSYINSAVKVFCKIIVLILQIIILTTSLAGGIYNKFFVFVLIGVLGQFINNLIVKVYVDKKYPYIIGREQLGKNERTPIYKNAIGAAIYKIADRVSTSADSIILSMCIGTIIVGTYSNYLYLVSFVTTITAQIFTSFSASIGDLIASAGKEKKNEVFFKLNYLNFLVYGFCAVCLWTLLNPFIELWLGEEYLLSKITVFAIVLNYLSEGLQHTVSSYRMQGGLYWKGKICPLMNVSLNVFLSIILANRFGIAGVLFATSISRFASTWWYDARLIFENILESSVVQYYRNYLFNLGITFFACGIVSIATLPFSEGGIINFLITIIVCIVLTTGIFWLYSRKKDEYKYFKNIMINFINKKIKKK